jgi:hypothetical protein
LKFIGGAIFMAGTVYNLYKYVCLWPFFNLFDEDFSCFCLHPKTLTISCHISISFLSFISKNVRKIRQVSPTKLVEAFFLLFFNITCKRCNVQSKRMLLSDV